MKTKLLAPRPRKERGITIVISTMGMTLFLLMAGLAIDISHLYLAGAELQNAADASAIAAASLLNGTADGVSAAVDAAIAVQNRFEFGTRIAPITRADVTFAVNFGDFGSGGFSEASARGIPGKIRFVNVAIKNIAIEVPFMGLALNDSVSSSASAGSTHSGSVHRGANSGGTATGTSTDNPAATVSLTRESIAGLSAGLSVLCDTIVPLSVVQDDVTHAPLDVDAACQNKWAFTPGCKYIVRRGSNGNNTGGVSAGNYLILALAASRGGSDARAGVAGSAAGCFRPGDIVGTETGIKSGPIQQGMNTRFGDYASGLNATVFMPDTNVKESITFAQYQSGLAAYRLAPNVAGRLGRRIIVIPIINLREYDNGRGTVKIYKFAAFFLQNRVNGNGDIWAEYITTNVQVNDGFISGGDDGKTQFSIPVLYR